MKKLYLLSLSIIITLSACAMAEQINGTPLPSPTIPLQMPGSRGEIISPADGMSMRFVDAGSYPMGTDNGLVDERPVHTVYLDSYWVDKTEVTNTMYALCVKSGKCKEPSVTVFYDEAAYKNHPVQYVSWNDSENYCAWAGRRLLTEAEWEKAATWNANTNEKYIYPWGNDFSCTKGNFDDETAVDEAMMTNTIKACDGFERTSPAGSFPQGASPYGVLDMGGNVWEWVHDAFIEEDPFNGSTRYYYEISPLNNPQGVDPSLSEYRVMRGGSWNWTFGFGRAAYRLWFGLDDNYEGVGFRCGMDGE